jgi:YfiR/HmsC-like
VPVDAITRSARGRQALLVKSLALALCLASPLLGLEDESSRILEYRVKAAFLYNFARFVTWPSRLESETGVVVIGILGPDPFGDLLESTVAGKTVSGRPFEVRRFSTAAEAADCHLVFITQSEKHSVEEAIAALHGTATLTVGESEGFVDQGGMIGFVIQDQAVRIDINLDAAREEGLEVSSQLLRVARTIRQTGRRLETP